MILILLGPPGSGKGTQAKQLATERHWPQLSTGDMLRSAIRSGSTVGREAKALMDQGLLVPDSIVVQLIEERIQREDCNKGFVLDGFPRNLQQAEALDQMLTRQGKRVDRVLFFNISESVLIKRLSGRRTCLNCAAMYHIETARPKKDGICDDCGQALIQRDDDHAEIIKKRQVVYYEQTEPLVAFYRDQDKLRSVDATGSAQVVAKLVAGALE